MGLESATYISDLVITNPTGADDRSTSDDHHRLIKAVLKTSFPNINGAVTATLAEINKLDGLNSTQDELNLLSGRSLASNDDVIDNFEAGIKTLFQQSAAPTGWTKQTTHNDKTLRVVSGTASSGGSIAFTTLFDAATTTSSHVLTAAELPAHDHGSAGAHQHAAAGSHSHTIEIQVSDIGGGTPALDGPIENIAVSSINTVSNVINSSGSHQHASAGAHTHASVGSDTGHNHTMPMDVNYVDAIICSKD